MHALVQWPQTERVFLANLKQLIASSTSMRDNKTVCVVWMDTICVTVGTTKHDGQVSCNWKDKHGQ